MDQTKESIVCSAVWFDIDESHVHQPVNKKTGLTITGMRHHNCFYTASLIGNHLRDKEPEQGFITSQNRFVDRKEGAKIAFVSGQIESPVDTLYSEDLW